ncbi:MAG: hypothetical protein EOO53_22550 [Gammaproteobacteria bacterium]|nr:MAG: hypothetical protein EOO53_22550 [Gammaproteobacteria bacterium]
MRRKPTIQKFLAGLLLVVFTISAIPQSFFHDLIARHKDVVGCEHPGEKAACVHPQSFHCGFSDLVVSAPYLSCESTSELARLVYPAPEKSDPHRVSLSLYSSYTEGRGPPSAL